MIAATLVIAASGRAGHGRVYETTENPTSGRVALAGSTDHALERKNYLLGGSTTEHGDIGTPAFSIPSDQVQDGTAHDDAGRLVLRLLESGSDSDHAGWLRAYSHTFGGWNRGARARRAAQADALIAARWLTERPMNVPGGLVEVSSDEALSDVRDQGMAVFSPDCYANILARYEWDVPTMKAIFWRESNCQLDPPHSNLSRAICQAFGPVWQWLLDMYDWAHSPEQAIEMCHVIFDRGGYAPWTP